MEKKKFMLTARITVSAFTVVEAETLEQAIEISKERSAEWHDYIPIEDEVEEEWIVTEIDGEPFDIDEG